MPTLPKAGQIARAVLPVINLYVRPRANAPLDDQLLYGQEVEVLEQQGGYICAAPIDPISGKRGNAGYIRRDISPLALINDPPTHKVSTLSAPVFSQPDIKSALATQLSLGSRVVASGEDKTFIHCALGFIHKAHVSPIDVFAGDWVAAAQTYLNQPYIWGGRSATGVDCSGLVQNALHAGGIACPRNSGEQAERLGVELGISGGLPALRRGDLVFWRGHVGIMTDEHTLLHANAYHMICAVEPLAGAVARISAHGPVTGLRRL